MNTSKQLLANVMFGQVKVKEPKSGNNDVGNVAILRDRQKAKRKIPLRYDVEMICQSCIEKLGIPETQLSYSNEMAFCQECGKASRVTCAQVPVY